MSTPSLPQCHGLMAEFDNPDRLLTAAGRSHAAGYRRMDAYSPLPIHGLAEALGMPRTRLPYLVFACGLIGALAGYGLQYWVNVVEYPLNVAGRPLHSGPSFIPVTFETTILFAGLAAFLGMLIANRLPMPYHPVFNLPAFARASQDRFFLCIEADDPMFDTQETRRFLESLDPLEVAQVER